MVTIPIWLLIVGGVVLVAGVGFLLFKLLESAVVEAVARSLW